MQRRNCGKAGGIAEGIAKWNAGTARAMLAADGIGTRGARWRRRIWRRRIGRGEPGGEDLKEIWRRRTGGEEKKRASFGSPWNTSSKVLERLPVVVVFNRLFDAVRKVGEKVQAGPAFNLVHAYRVIPI